MLIGNHLGQGRWDEALQYGYATELIAVFFGLLLVLLLLSFPRSIVEIFNRDPQTVALGVEGIRFFVVFLFINMIGHPFETIFTHNGWGRFPLVAELVSILTFTLLFVRHFGMGITAARFSLGLYTLCYTLLLSGGFWSKRWLKVRVEEDQVNT